MACDMTDAEDTVDERLAEYQKLFRSFLKGAERTDTSLVLHFAGGLTVAGQVTDLAEREAACCPFLRMDVDQHGDQIAWTLSSVSGPAGQTVLDGFYALSTA